MTLRYSLLSAVALTLVACGSSGDLSPDAVQGIPAGDALGSAHSGEYSLDLRITECSGACGPFRVSGFLVTLCDVGDTDFMYVDVTQSDGALSIDTDDLPSRFEGGVDADGRFDVGGYATQFGGALQITARSQGSIEGDTLEATLRSRTVGSFEGQSADCIGVREVTGTR